MNPDLILGGVVPNLVNKKSEVQKLLWQILTVMEKLQTLSI